jgi:hypothetical protein
VIERAYTLDEIDRLRRATHTWYYLGRFDNDAQRATAIEEKLRTLMMNGTDPAEIEEKIKIRRGMWQAARIAREVLTGKSDRALWEHAQWGRVRRP